MRVAIAQINSCLGDFEANQKKILEAAQRAGDADLVVFPEAALFGYPPVDTLENEFYFEAQNTQLQAIKTKWQGRAKLLFGAITKNEKPRGKRYHNSAVLLDGGEFRFFHKTLLPSYDVFDETRYIEPGTLENNVFETLGCRILVTVCEDIWGWEREGASVYSRNPLEDISPDAVDLVINLSASPYAANHFEQRMYMAGETVRHFQCPLVYVNMCGGQDELIFDGGSFVMNEKAQVERRLPVFKEGLETVDLFGQEKRDTPPFSPLSAEEELFQALVLGIRDFVSKTGFQKVHFGLSGGIDSALVAALAAEALGPENVVALALPTQFNLEESFTLAKELTSHLGIAFQTIPVGPFYDELASELAGPLELREMSTIHENLQSRIRGLILMAFSNRHFSMLLTTGNKTEYATGYATLYGDMCGGLAPIADLTKKQVFRLAEYINERAGREIIPQRIIDRPPSAELRPGQTDEQSLPPYKVLDKAVKDIVEKKRDSSSEVENFVMQALHKTEFKRWQAPPVLRVSTHSFGRGRRWPIANGFELLKNK